MTKLDQAAIREMADHWEFPLEDRTGKYQVDIDFAPEGRIIDLSIIAHGENAAINEGVFRAAVTGATTLRNMQLAMLAKEVCEERNE